MARSTRLFLVMVFALACVSAAWAQNYRDTARNTGYADGLDKGSNDARQNKSFDLNRHDAYKDADHGYRDSFRNKADYQRMYRQSFERGYREGFQRTSGVPGGRQQPGMRPSPGVGPDNQAGPPGHWPVPGRRVGQRRRDEQQGGFGQRGRDEQPGGYGRAMAEAARNNGYNDGLEKGRNDASQRKSSNPNRHDAYKDADHGYSGSFGDKQAYKNAYRQAFVQGYQEGFRGSSGRRR